MSEEKKNRDRETKHEEVNKVNLAYNLELERKESKELADKGYDFIPRVSHLTSIEEQKIKTSEIEDKTK